MTKETTDHLESIGWTFCYQLYKKRFELYSRDEDSDTDDTEDETDIVYMIHQKVAALVKPTQILILSV